jgi:hypothetical protein
MDPATYWRLRYLQAEAEKSMLVAAHHESRYREALQAAGIDPAVPHTWHDEATTLTPVDPAEQATK